MDFVYKNDTGVYHLSEIKHQNLFYNLVLHFNGVDVLNIINEIHT